MGEYAFRQGGLSPPWHFIYDATHDGCILLATYHGVAFTLELTGQADKAARKKALRPWFFFFWLMLIGLNAPNRLWRKGVFFYACNGARLLGFVGVFTCLILWYHRQAKTTANVLTRYRMNLMKLASCVCMLYPLALVPHAERYSPRPNVIIAVMAGILFYLGYVMPRWFKRLLYAFSLSLPDSELQPYLALVGVIGNFYHWTPTDCFFLEKWVKLFGAHLGLPSGQISLLVRASYLLDIGRLRDSSPSGAAVTEAPASVRQHSAEVVEEILEFRDIAHVIRHVHERWDGTGYPDGMSGQEIPFESRVLALMEVFAGALYLSRRKDVRVALKAVKEKKGAFDPQLVEALEKMISTGLRQSSQQPSAR
ncbi:hypothetical protein HYR99_38325 [Candidatus Poribacteria bacterium]|nr:hypothetical protein [Candidatus Poribacteria bacterium]